MSVGLLRRPFFLDTTPVFIDLAHKKIKKLREEFS